MQHKAGVYVVASSAVTGGHAVAVIGYSSDHGVAWLFAIGLLDRISSTPLMIIHTLTRISSTLLRISSTPLMIIRTLTRYGTDNGVAYWLFANSWTSALRRPPLR